MFPRLPGPIGADIFLGATTTVRSVFPNSRLDSLTNAYHRSSPSNGGNTNAATASQSAATGSTSTAPAQHQQQQHQLHSPHVPTVTADNNAATATMTNVHFTPHYYNGGGGAGGGGGGGAADVISGSGSGVDSNSNNNAIDSSSIGAYSHGGGGNLLPQDDDDWWSNAIEEDSFHSPLAFDASENGLWNGRFVPPPPRPPFLDENVAADGLTTCDLCTWAWQRNTLDGSMDPAGELGWAFTLIIVSVISALVGAIIMVVVLRCKRIKSANNNGGRPQPWWPNRGARGQNGRSPMSVKHSADSIRRPTSNSGVWTWLGGSRRSSAGGPDQIGPPSSSPAENHYTHMDDAYSPVGVSEALYAELDRESVRSGNPSYQNTAYSQCGEKYNFQQHEQDIPMVVSSAPSSAYYSDLSVTAMLGGGGNERAYEIVGLTVMSQPLPNWDSGGMLPPTATTAAGGHLGAAAIAVGGGYTGGVNLANTQATTDMGMSSQRRLPRLAAINETSTSTVPSDYV